MQSANSAEYKVTVFGSTNVGSVRSHNEDNFLVSDLTAGISSLRPEVRSHQVGDRGSLFMVADGMGGGAAGEVASQMAINSVFERLLEQLKSHEQLDRTAFAYGLKEAVEHANRMIYRESRNNPEYKGMGTTTSAAGFFGGTLYIAQVGDSRAYLVRRGIIKQITKDQSLVNKLLDAGLITEEEAENHENKNVILQALGVSEAVDVVLSCIDIRQDDMLILCSDGLSGLVKADEIRQVAESTEDQVSACRQLIDMANERGGYDNITVIIAKFNGSGLPAAQDQDIIEYTLFEDQTTSTTRMQGSPTSPAEKKKPLEEETPRASKHAVAGAVLLLAAAVAFVLWGLLRPAEESSRAGGPAPVEKQPLLRTAQAPQASAPQATASLPPAPAPQSLQPMEKSTREAVLAADALKGASTTPALPSAKRSIAAPDKKKAPISGTVANEKVRTFEEFPGHQAGRNREPADQQEGRKELPPPAVSAAPPPAEVTPPAADAAPKNETAEPNLVPVTIAIQTNPSGLFFSIDGEEITLSTPQEVKVKPGRHVLKFKFGPLIIEKPIEVHPDAGKPFVFDFEAVIKKPPPLLLAALEIAWLFPVTSPLPIL